MITAGTKIESSHVKYQVVKDAFEEMGIDSTVGDPEAPIFWWDGDISRQNFTKVAPNQRINKIPGMDYLCFKSTFIHSMNQMRRLFPKNYTIFPTSFLLPHQLNNFQREHERLQRLLQKPVTWIVKPRSGCCGHGIRLIQNLYEINRKLESVVVQRYIEPFCLKGYKFDFRFYVLISNLSPYTVYIYKEGLARFCTGKYKTPSAENMCDKFAHLTNTSVNVENKNPDNDFTRLSSSVLKEINDLRPGKGAIIWEKIKQATALTMLAMWNPIVNSINNTGESSLLTGVRYSYSTPEGINKYHKFFHILGIDIMLNENLHPIVLELNDRPSMMVTFDIEKDLKTNLIKDTLKTISTDGSPATPSEPTLWEQILPTSVTDPFSKTVDSICLETCSVLRTFPPSRAPSCSSVYVKPTFADQ